MRAMIANTDKSQFNYLDDVLSKRTSSELKLAFDFCQGRFGGEGFSYRRHPNYFYLSSLVATFPEFDLSRNIWIISRTSSILTTISYMS